MKENTQKHILGRKFLLFLSFALILILTSVIYERGIHTKSSEQNVLENFQEAFLQADKILTAQLDTLAKPNYLHNDSLTDSYIRANQQFNFSFFIFKYISDSLTFWSENAAPLPEIHSPQIKTGSIVNLPNGKYFYRDRLMGEVRLAGLFLIKSEYPYQNIYLENRYHKAFRVPIETKISSEEGSSNIYTAEGSFVCSLEVKQGLPLGLIPSMILLALYALAFLALSAAIYHLYIKLQVFHKSNLLLILAYVIDIVILRAIMFIFKIPSGLYNSEIFKPGTFAASDIIPSPGDFFFNALALLCITYVLFVTYKNIDLSKRRPKLRRYILIYSLFLHIFIFYRLLLGASESLIMDATFSMNLNQIFFLTPYSFLALIILTLLLVSFFFVSYRILGLSIHHSGKSALTYFSFFIATSGLYFLICYLFLDCNYFLFLPLLAYIVVVYFLAIPGNGATKISFSSVVIYLFLFSVLGTSILSFYNDRKEAEQRKLLSISLSSGEDPLSEYIFNNVCKEMAVDTSLQGLLFRAPFDWESEDQANDYIEENYLSPLLHKYEWMITICTPDRDLILQRDGDTLNCYFYFNTIIEDISQPAYGKHLYRYDNGAGMSNYISRQEFYTANGQDTVCVFIELFSFFIPEEGLGYPELLIDEKIKTFAGLENYSYARYKDGELVFKYGDYPYSTDISLYLQDTTDVFFDHNNSSHYISQIEQGEHLIISKNVAGYLQIVAPFSYLLIFFTLFLLIFLLGVNIPFTAMVFELNFRNRLQLYIISLIIVSFVIIGIITVSYVINLNTSKNKQILQEKTHSVLIELEHKLAGEEQLTPDMEEYLTTLLIKFSQVFFSDINLYDLSGRLLASSRPQIFQKQLISKRMNADAYKNLSINRKLLYLHTETIGDQDYYSAYVPFRNEKNHVVAYLNLPYFARQTELQSEISAFLNAFLNVYVLMMAMAIFIALMISRFTTRPLQLIRDKMRSLSLGGTNEMISWSRKDEIGTLIAEYNRMVDELSKSADLLAKSERESAWREMAKQVAHEIKNPLTPMKLSVQYLQKAWDEKSPDWEERLNRFTQTIIEHIDTLSDIATEFSDFAKMPQKKEDKIDLSATIRKSLDLFSDIENIQFSLSEYADGPHYVFADKNQLIRVFNNLIKNSVQAIGKIEGGKVKINIEQKELSYFIRVSDNGPGIPDDMFDKIFSPSFTTKTSGMGLGLALVRSIIHEAKGEISFESSPETGTLFIIRLPVYS